MCACARCDSKTEKTRLLLLITFSCFLIKLYLKLEQVLEAKDYKPRMVYKLNSYKRTLYITIFISPSARLIEKSSIKSKGTKH